MGGDSAQGQPGFWFRMRGFIKYKVSKGKRTNSEEQTDGSNRQMAEHHPIGGLMTSGRGDWRWLAEVMSEVPIGNSWAEWGGLSVAELPPSGSHCGRFYTLG